VNSNLAAEFLDASMVILDISDPEAPVFLDNPNNPVSIPSLSGQTFLDETSQQLFVTNRFSENKNDVIDDLLVIDVNEGSNLGTLQTFEAGENPFGIACCDSSDRFYVVSDGTLEVFSLNDPSQKVSRSLEVILSNGTSFSGLSSTHVAILDNQAFVSNRAGVIYVINLDTVGDTSKNPIDYLITNLDDLRSIATDGTNIYIAEVDFEDDDVTRFRSIDPTTVPPIADNEGTVIEVDVEDTEEYPDILKQSFALGLEPQETLIFNNMAFVTNMDSNSVTAFDISDPDNVSLETTIDLTDGGFTSDEPFGMAAATIDGTDYLYVTNLDSDNISIVDLTTNTVVGTYP
jgi:YVTN family beta-propeller protein